MVAVIPQTIEAADVNFKWSDENKADSKRLFLRSNCATLHMMIVAMIPMINQMQQFSGFNAKRLRKAMVSVWKRRSRNNRCCSASVRLPCSGLESLAVEIQSHNSHDL